MHNVTFKFWLPVRNWPETASPETDTARKPDVDNCKYCNEAVIYLLFVYKMRRKRAKTVKLFPEFSFHVSMGDEIAK